jgi:Secretion system C-terminal sorting domain
LRVFNYREIGDILIPEALNPETMLTGVTRIKVSASHTWPARQWLNTPCVAGSSDPTCVGLHRGYIDPYSPDTPEINLTVPGCEITNSTTSGFSISTYVYDIPGYGYYPMAPNEISFKYTSIGDTTPPIVPQNLSFLSSGNVQVHIAWEYDNDTTLTNNANLDYDYFEIYRWAEDEDVGWTLLEILDDHHYMPKVFVKQYQDLEYWGPLSEISENGDAVVGQYKVVAVDEVGLRSESLISGNISDHENSAIDPNAKEIGDNLPERTELLGNYPNPFNGMTLLKYAMRARGDVDIRVYDILGKEILHEMKDGINPGYHSIQIDMTTRSSGVYFVKSVLDGKIFNQKIILIK